MKEKQVKLPDLDCPIGVECNPARVVLIDATQEEEVL
jgi:hypothetical protein